MDVYVIRHTQPAVASNLCYGQADVPLAETFQQEANDIRSRLPEAFDTVYCSPLARCHALASELNLAAITFDDNLKEMSFGQWENQKWDEINQEQLHSWMADFANQRTPEGESLGDLYQRVEAFIATLNGQSHNKVLVVTHGGVIRCMWSYMLEMPLRNVFKLRVSYGEIMAVKFTGSPQMDRIIRKE